MNTENNLPPSTNSSGRGPLLSIVTSAFNEENNIPELYNRLKKVLDETGKSWEWIVVDDSSTDETFGVLKSLAEKEKRLRCFRFSRNFGAHAALTCGIDRARGKCAVILAGDLQDPPEEIPKLLSEWEGGAQVVWAVREKREGEKGLDLLFSRLYYAVMRRTGALKDIPATGSDFFLIDRVVIDAFNRFPESNLSIMALISWMGFRQTYFNYAKQPRLHGSSGWDAKKKLKLVVDSITSFTYFPIRLISYLGFAVALIGFSYAAIVIVRAAVLGSPVEGWTSMMVVLLVVSGMMMLMMGVLGEYLWRSLNEARRRPRYIIGEAIEEEE